MASKNNQVYYINGGGDEQYTPPKTVEILLPHIQHLKGKTIWLPFDREDSQFVKVLKANGFKVVYSHIDYGQDFFNYEPDKWDVIISNPPYTNKRAYWERCLAFVNATLAEREREREDAPARELQLLIPSRRTKFYNAKTGKVGGQPTFKAAYFGVDIFKRQIILAELEKEEK